MNLNLDGCTSGYEILTQIRASILHRLDSIVRSSEKIQVESVVQIVEFLFKIINSHPQVFDKSCVDKTLEPLVNLSICSSVYYGNPDLVLHVCKLVCRLMVCSESVNFQFIQKVLNTLFHIGYLYHKSLGATDFNHELGRRIARAYKDALDCESCDIFDFSNARSNQQIELVGIDGLLQLVSLFCNCFCLTPIQLSKLFPLIGTLIVDHLSYFTRTSNSNSILALNLIFHSLKIYANTLKNSDFPLEHYEPAVCLTLACINAWNLAHNDDLSSAIYEHAARLRRLLEDIENVLSQLLHAFSHYCSPILHCALLTYWPAAQCGVRSDLLNQALIAIISNSLAPSTEHWQNVLSVTQTLFDNEKLKEPLTRLFVNFYCCALLETTPLDDLSNVTAISIASVGVPLDRRTVVRYWIERFDSLQQDDMSLEQSGNALLLGLSVIHEIWSRDASAMLEQDVQKLRVLLFRTSRAICQTMCHTRNVSSVICLAVARLAHQILLMLFEFHVHFGYCGVESPWYWMNEMIAHYAQEQQQIDSDVQEYVLVLCCAYSIFLPQHRCRFFLSMLNGSERLLACALAISIRIMACIQDSERTEVFECIRRRIALIDTAAGALLGTAVHELLLRYTRLLHGTHHAAATSFFGCSDDDGLAVSQSGNWLNEYFSSQLPRLFSWSTCYKCQYGCTEDAWLRLRHWLVDQKSLMNVAKVHWLLHAHPSSQSYSMAVCKFLSEYWEYAKHLIVESTTHFQDNDDDEMFEAFRKFFLTLQFKLDDQRLRNCIWQCAQNFNSKVSEAKIFFDFAKFMFIYLLDAALNAEKHCFRMLLSALLAILSSENENLPISDISVKLIEQHALTSSLEKRKRLIELAGYLGCVVSECYLEYFLIFISRKLTDKFLIIRKCALEAINQVSRYKKLSLKSLLAENKKVFWVFFKDVLRDPQLLDEVCICLLDQSVGAFLEENSEFLIPKIFTSKHREAILKIASNSVDITRLARDNIQPIFFAILCKGHDKYETAKYLYHLVGHTASIKQIFDKNKVHMIVKITSMFGSEGTKVRAEKMLLYLIQVLELKLASAEFLKEHFLEVLSTIVHNYLFVPSVSLRDKKSLILGFKHLVEHIRPYLEYFYLKIIALVKTAAIDPGLQVSVCQSLLYILKLFPKEFLRAVFVQVVTCLFSYIDKHEREVLQVLEYLFITEFNVLSCCFKQIPMIPDLPSLQHIYAAWSDVTNRNNMSLLERLEELSSLIINEHEEIRDMALKKLYDFLCLHKTQILELVLADKSGNLIISDLIERLFVSSRTRSRTLRIQFATCLGKLGAIDPGRLSVNFRMRKFEFHSNYQNLACLLIEKYLIHMYRTALSMGVQDQACCTIQNILKYFNNEDASSHHPSSNNIENQLWNQLQPETQSIIYPFLHSSYVMDTSRLSIPECPIYRVGIDHRSWIHAWIQQLILSSKIPFYQACLSLPTSLEINHFLLPHIVLSVLQGEDCVVQREICTEILHVISNNQNLYGPVNQMVTQSVFDLIDCIFQWRYKLCLQLTQLKKMPNMQQSQIQLVNKKIRTTDNILESIPKSQLVECAFASCAYSRGLLYAELLIWEQIQSATYPQPPENTDINSVCQYLQEISRSKEQIISKHANDLQKLYLKLEDSDSIMGLNSIKAKNSVIDLILHYQASRKWSEVLIVLDQVLHTELDSEAQKSLQLIKLEALKELGQFDQVVSMAKLTLHEAGITCSTTTTLSEEHKNTYGLSSFNPSSTEDSYSSEQPFKLKLSKDSSRLGNKNFFTKFTDIGIRDEDTVNLNNLSPLDTSYINTIHSFGISAALHLNDWNSIQELSDIDQSLRKKTQSIYMSFDIGIGRILLALQKKDYFNFSNTISMLQSNLIDNLTLTSFESYERSYLFVVQLHVLSDLMDLWKLLDGSIEKTQWQGAGSEVSAVECSSSNEDSLLSARRKIISDWNTSLDLLPRLYTQREQILSMRIVAMDMCKLDSSRAWLDLAKYSRKSGRKQTTQYSLLKIGKCLQFESALCACKLLWQDKQESLALIEIRRIMDSCLDIIGKLDNGKLHFVCNVTLSESLNNIARRCEDGAMVNENGKVPERLVSHYSRERLSNVYNKSVILATRWMQEMGYSTQSIIIAYEQCYVNSPNGRMHYEYGRFLDRIACEYLKFFKGQFSEDAANLSPMRSYWLYFSLALRQYSASICRECKYVDQILPRFLTMCINTANAADDATAQQQSSKKPKTAAKTVSKGAALTFDANLSSYTTCYADAHEFFATVNSFERLRGLIHAVNSLCLAELGSLLEKIPPSCWFVAHPLLISSCANQNANLSLQISKAILCTMLYHPERAMWAVVPMGVSKNRAKRYEWLLEQLSVVSDRSGVSKLATADYFVSASKFIDSLLQIFTWKPQRSSNGKASKYKFSNVMPRLNQADIPESIMMPTQSQLSGNFSESGQVNIRGFGKDVIVLTSKQKPCRIEILGSDGKPYPFLCKAGDDMRRDARIMEFSTLVNELLKKDVETRSRQMHIRTYSVVALREKMGLLGWVMNTSSLKDLVTCMMALEGKNFSKIFSQLAGDYWQKNLHKTPTWTHIYATEVQGKVPSVLWKWFVVSFPDPSSYLKARTNYTRTTAVMSIVGAILGLGDRHCENIMLDTATGDCVHVDLNCIFYQGLELEVPEIVPFRLTQNMIDAFGVLGYEGCFRHTCELTMKKLRENKNTLISVLETLLHDPFECKSLHSKKKIGHEHFKEILEILDSVSDRIQGTKGSPYLTTCNESLFPLSTQVHVDTLIKEATSIERLSKMYIGWNAFI